MSPQDPERQLDVFQPHFPASAARPHGEQQYPPLHRGRLGQEGGRVYLQAILTNGDEV